MTLVNRRISSVVELGSFDLREEDKLEALAQGCPWEDAVTESFRESWRNFASYDSDVLLAVWGVRPISILGGVVDVWMFSTPAVATRKVLFARGSVALRDRLLEEYSALRVWVSRNYADAVKWLDWLGFKELRSSGGDLMFMQRNRWGN